MKGVILVGGYGTRLQPLTDTVPKPMIPVLDKSVLEMQIAALAEIGIKRIVLATCFMHAKIVNTIPYLERKYCVSIDYTIETVPLGTGGAIKNLSRFVENENFIVLNSDIVCNFPFSALLSHFIKFNCVGTIVTTKVEEPSKYGIVNCYENSPIIKEFIEKPQFYAGNEINAGIYLFTPEVMNYIELKETAVSIEKEVFPLMAENRVLTAFCLEGYWMDLGNPIDYIRGTELCLSSRGVSYYANDTAIIAKQTRRLTNCCIHENVTVGEDAYIDSAILLDNVKVGDACLIVNTIVGWNATIGNNCNIKNCVLGENVVICDNVTIEDAKIKKEDILSKENTAADFTPIISVNKKIESDLQHFLQK